jgi:hypothetical protein
MDTANQPIKQLIHPSIVGRLITSRISSIFNNISAEMPVDLAFERLLPK